MLNNLVPLFLKRLDHYLLLHYRLLWISKIHYVLFYSILALVFGSALIYAYPLTPANDLPAMSMVLLIAIGLVAPACVYWIYWQTIYGVENAFGLRFRGIAYLRFALQFLCFGIWGSLVLALTFLVEHRIVNLVSKEELINDINKLNIGNPYMPSRMAGDTLWHDTKREKADFTRSIMDKNIIRYVERNGNIVEVDYPYSFQYFDAYGLQTKLRGNESNSKALCITSSSVFLALFFEKIKDDRLMLQAIENYIHTFNKYSKIKIKEDANVFFKNYLAKIVILDEQIGKQQVKEQIYELSKIMRKPFFRNFERHWEAFLVIVSIFSVLLFNFHYVGKVEFVAGVLSTIVAFAMIAYVCAFLLFSTNTHNEINASRLATIILFDISILLCLFYCFLNHFDLKMAGKRAKGTLLIITSIGIAIGLVITMMYLFEHYGTLWYIGVEYFSTTRDIHSHTLYSCLSIYFFIFIPLFHQFFVKMRSLPR